MKLQVIYSHEHGQEIADFDFDPAIIETRQSFIDFCVNAIKMHYAFHDSVVGYANGEPKKEIPEIIKLSGCVYLEGGIFAEPHWWKVANGKVYFFDEPLKIT